MADNQIAYVKDFNKGASRGYVVTLGAGIHTYGVRHLDGQFIVELNSGTALAIRKYGHEAGQFAWENAINLAKNLSRDNFVDETNPELRKSCLEGKSFLPLRKTKSNDFPISC